MTFEPMFSFASSKLKPFVILANVSLTKLGSAHNSRLQIGIILTLATSIFLIAQKE